MRSNDRSRLGFRLTAATSLTALLAIPSAAADEGDSGGCPVVASAQGVQVTVSVTENLVSEAPTGAVVPMAQACVDYGVSDSLGFAANPYPGETVLAAPAIVRGKGAPAPDYPAHVASRYPSKENARAEGPGFALSATSSETATDARAFGGAGEEGNEAGSGLATASAKVDPGARTAVATAASDVQAVTINEVIELGRTRSTAEARIGADGAVTRTSTLTIGRTTVAGQAVEITPEGVRAAGQTAPLPDAEPAEQLKAAGIAVRYLAEQKTSRGVLSAGIEVTVRQPVADTGSELRTAYTFGRSWAAVAPVEAPDGGVSIPVPPLAKSGGNHGPAPGAAPVADADLGGNVPDSGQAPLKAPEAPPALAGDSAPPEVVVAAPGQLVGNPADMGLEGSYLVFGFAALAMFASGLVLRLLGVRTRWSA